MAEDLIKTAIDPYYERPTDEEGKVRENGFYEIYKSTGRSTTCTAMPAPTTGMDTGMDGIVALEGEPRTVQIRTDSKYVIDGVCWW